MTNNGGTAMLNKKYFAIILVFVLLSGCANGSVGNDNAVPANANNEQNNEMQISTAKIIDKKLDAIISDLDTEQLPRNPAFYVQERNYAEYEDIINLGDDAFNYMLESFAVSQEDGWKEYIMAMACSEILGETEIDWSTGEEWYTSYISGERQSYEHNTLEVELSDRFQYSSTYPNLEIVCDKNKINWIRGDANYTGKAGGKIGNTTFGLPVEQTDKLTPNIVKPESELIFNADEVQGLNKPEFELQLLNKNKTSFAYPLTENTMIVPKEEGEYIFFLEIDWGNGDNAIYYWFKLKV